MPSGGRFDFFLSRRGSVAEVAQEVTGVLTDQGYSVVVQDYDIPITANFIEAMHEAIKNARDLVVLFTGDYEGSPYTRKEFTSFEADRAQSTEQRRVIILRCEDTSLRGLFAPNVYQDLVGIDDPAERRRRILAAVQGESQASKPLPLMFVGVPPRIASFTGRTADLDRLDTILLGGKPAAVTQATASLATRTGMPDTGRAAVHGMGGVGKTSLAVEYAYRYRDLYAGVWWCPAETRTGLLTSLAALAVELGAAAADESDIEKAARSALRRLAERRATVLLIYDNVANPDEIADLLPVSGARVLVTSRFSDWSGWAEEVALDVMLPSEASDFLQHRAGRQDDAGAFTLADAVGYLPLALDHAAAYCKRTQMHFADYAAKVGSLASTLPRGTNYPRSVAATFELALAAAATQCAEADTLIAFLAQCAPERIPLILVKGALKDEVQRTQALLALSETSLVRHDPFEDGTPAVTVHRLVQAVARAITTANGGASSAAEVVVQRLTEIYPNDGYGNPLSWSLCAQLTPHLLAQCEPGTTAGSAGQANLLTRAASYLYGRAAYSTSRLLMERVLMIRENVLGLEHPYTAASLHSLATLLRDQGDYKRARPLMERALAIREKVLGPEHAATAQSLDNLGLLLLDMGDNESQHLLERALAIREKVLGPEDPDTAWSLNHLGALFRSRADYARARPLFERALAIQESALGVQHPAIGWSLTHVATVLEALGEFPSAWQLLERALMIREDGLGPEHPDTAQSLNSLGKMLHAQGDLNAARPLHERALTIREKLLGPEHHHTAQSLNNLACVLEDLGDLAAARPLLERALMIFEKAFGPEHPSTARARYCYAHLLLAAGDPGLAQAEGNIALSVHEKALGLNHPWTADSVRITADALIALGRIQEADSVRQRYGTG